MLSDNDDNCLIYACHNNTNIKIIKYLIEDLLIDISQINKRGNNCLMDACANNTNYDIIKYLFEDISINILQKNNDIIIF